MRRFKWLFLTVIIMVMMSGCSENWYTPTPGRVTVPPVSNTTTAIEPLTPSATNTDSPTATASPQATLNPTPSTTATIEPGEIPIGLPNLIPNPQFNGEITAVDCNECNVYPNWTPVWTIEDARPWCTPGQESGCNQPGLQTGRPEWKAASPDLLEGGQQWFCYQRACNAGIQTTVTVQAGDQCVAGMRYTSKTNPGPIFSGDYPSTLNMSNPDDSIASQWTIRIQGETTQAESQTVYGDHELEILDVFFIPQDDRITVSFMNTRIWPVQHQDNIIHEAYLFCWSDGDQATPTPIIPQYPPTVTIPTPDIEPTCNSEDFGSLYVGAVFTTWDTMNARPCPNATLTTPLYKIPVYTSVEVLRIFSLGASEKWILVNYNGDHVWIAYIYDGVRYGEFE